MSKPTDLVQGTLDLLILKTISHEPQHGWAIAKRIQQISKEALQIQQGSLYPALHRLEKAGALTASWRASERGPRRRYYAITEDGKRLYAEASREWEAIASGVSRVAEVPSDA